ncbi:MAG: class I adenylate-forming enzyme family protein [Candidatus Binatia bacterium]
MTLGECLRRAAREAPDREAYLHRGERLRYADWQALAERAAAGLVSRGAEKGDRIALVLPPRPEYAVAYLAAAKAGLVTAGVNPRLADREIAHVLADSGARFVVTIDRFGGREIARLVESLADDLPELGRTFVVRDAAKKWSAPDALVVERTEPFANLFASPAADALRRLETIENGLGADDPVAIVYTSGTTGKPKGALFALRNLEAVSRTRGEMGTREGERTLTGGTPFAHIGFMTKIMAHIEDRQTTVILDAFNARTVLETVERERITYLGGVPAQWSLMLLDPDFDRFDLSSLRAGAIGGAPFTPELVREIRRRFGVDLVTRYSCTEIALGTGSRPDDPEELLAETVGRPSAEVELAIVDGDRRPLRAGEVGEVAVRSPAVMVGYWRRPEETAAVLDRDGWFYTADLGVIDERGYLSLRGRKKEMYIRGGYNVYPVEVEAVIGRHPDVAQVAVVGVPDRVLGEKGLAVLVPRAGRPCPSRDELRAFCAAEIADYKAPDFVAGRSELPMNAMYKVDKARLRDDWLANQN